jgi:hypothetical protein
MTQMAIDRELQSYAEDDNERELAVAVGGMQTQGSAPVDVVVIKDGIAVVGIELKTVLTNGNDKITMKAAAIERKHEWASRTGASLHTIVFDDRLVFGQDGRKLPEHRRVYHRPGCGSFRLCNMQEVVGGVDGVASLLEQYGGCRAANA